MVRRANPFPRKGDAGYYGWSPRSAARVMTLKTGSEYCWTGCLPTATFGFLLTGTYSVRISCGLFLAASNRGFAVSADVSKLLSDRNLEISFKHLPRPRSS